jgi:uncharacterized protein YraI
MFTKHIQNFRLAGLLILATFMIIASRPAQAADPTWEAHYWNNTTLSGAPVVTRQEAAINYSWGNNTPAAPGVNLDNFSARWTRSVNFPANATYRFSAFVDDGMRVWVDGVLVIDAWNNGPERTITGDRYLGAGDHEIVVEYFDAILTATAQFSWQAVSSPTIVNWRGEYYNNKTLTGSPVLVRDDAAINFDWNTGSPLPGTVASDNFSVRWTRNLNLTAGRYRFTVAADDGVRLWVNNALIIDQWRDQSLTTYSAEIDLPTGSIPVKMEYYDATGGAHAHLSWTPVGVNIVNWRGEYYNNKTLTGGPSVIRDDAQIDFNWGEGAPVAGIGNDNFSVRWTRTVNFTPGRYRFTTRVDDGVRLWVNNQLVVDRWYPQVLESVNAELELNGPVSIKMEYFEQNGFAEAHLSWVLVNSTPTGGSGGGGVGTATVASSLLNVRQGPGIGYSIITTISRGTVVQLAGYRNSTTTWVMIILADGRQGWSYAPFLQTSVNISALPVWTAPGSGGTPSGPTATVYGAYHLNVRSGPGTSFAPIMTIPRNTVVQLVGRNNAGTWLKIQMPSGTQGWSSASYLQTNYNIMDLQVLSS